MFKLLSRIIVNIVLIAVILLAVHSYSDGWFFVEASKYDMLLTFVFLAIVFYILNNILKVILRIVTLPLRILTLGLFSIVLNIAIIYLFSYVVNKGDFGIAIKIGTLLQVFILSIILSLPHLLIKKIK